MNNRKLAAVALTLALAWPQPLLAAAIRPQTTAYPGSVPQGINYQGRLEQNGSPVTGAYAMTFTLYNALTGGAALWTGAPQTVTVTAGLFNTVLPIPVTALVNGTPAYLEITVSGTTLSPREALQSVPYALVAKSVEGTLDVSTAGLNILPTPTGGSALFISSGTGFVGIGNTSPAARLHMSSGTLVIDGNLANSITTTGSVWIGTNNSTAKLHVAGGVTNLELTGVNGLGQRGSLQLLSDGHTVGDENGMNLNLQNAVGSSLNFAQMIAGVADPTAGAEQGYLRFTTKGASGLAERLRMTSTGRVGVGTTSPATLLDLNGDLTVRSSMTAVGAPAPQRSVAGQGAIYFDSGANRFMVSENGGPYGPLNPSAGGTVTSSETVAGALGIGAAGLSNGTLVVQSTSATSANPIADFRNNAGTSAMLVQQSGNVGIGNTSPTERFQVAGGRTILDSTGFGSNNGYAVRAQRQDDFFTDPTITTRQGQVFISNSGQTGTINNLLASVDFAGLSYSGGAPVSGFVGGRIAAQFPQSANNNTATDLVFLNNNNSPTLSERMRILANGNAGIGTSSPASVLSLSTAANNGADIRRLFSIQNNNNNTGVAAIAFSADSTYYKAGIGLKRGNPNGAGDLVFYNRNNLDTADFTAADAAMTIQQSGNVGIGIPSPGSKLHVQGQAIQIYDASANIGAAVKFLGTNTNRNFLIGNQFNVSDTLEFTPSTANGGTTFTTPAMVISGGGNVGIGTPGPLAIADVMVTPAHRVQVGGPGGVANDYILSTYYVGNVPVIRGQQVAQAETNLALQPFGGNVGIGTTSPVTKLHMSSGTLTVDGTGAALTVTGHIHAPRATAPTLGLCTSGTIGGSSSDVGGVVAFGAGAGSACTINFGTTWTANPICTVSGTSAGVTLAVASLTTTQLTVASSAVFPSGSDLFYICIGQ